MSELTVNKSGRIIAGPPDSADENQEHRTDVQQPAKPDPLLLQLYPEGNSAAHAEVAHEQENKPRRKKHPVHHIQSESEKASVCQAPDLRSLHAADDPNGLRKGICPEENPRKGHQKEGHQNLQYTVRAALPVNVKALRKGVPDGLQ